MTWLQRCYFGQVLFLNSQIESTWVIEKLQPSMASPGPMAPSHILQQYVWEGKHHPCYYGHHHYCPHPLPPWSACGQQRLCWQPPIQGSSISPHLSWQKKLWHLCPNPSKVTTLRGAWRLSFVAQRSVEQTMAQRSFVLVNNGWVLKGALSEWQSSDKAQRRRCYGEGDLKRIPAGWSHVLVLLQSLLKQQKKEREIEVWSSLTPSTLAPSE